MTTTAAEQAAEGQRPTGIAGAVHAYVDKLRGGDLGSLPAVLGLTALVILFGALKGDRFLSSFNFANLVGQAAMIVVIAMGLIFVLLLGEIDLAAGVTAGMCAAVLGVTMTEHGWPMPAALAACLLTGVVVGLGQGILVANFGIPSFVVTLATFLAFQGVLLIIIGEGGTIGIRDETILAIQNDNLPVWAGWALAAVVAGGYAGLTFLRRRGRVAAGLATEAMTVWLAKTGLLVAIVAAVTYFLSEERSRRPEITSIKGIPWALPLILVLFVGLTFLLTRTAFGRHVYAVGGNAEAARRAGFAVGLLLIGAMAVGGALAGLGGFAQLAGTEFKLRPGFLVTYGYIAFLASWLARHRPVRVAVAAVVLAAISVSGDSLQLDSRLPAATVNVLMALVLLAVFGWTSRRTEV